jgi:hypothetical protein
MNEPIRPPTGKPWLKSKGQGPRQVLSLFSSCVAAPAFLPQVLQAHQCQIRVVQVVPSLENGATAVCLAEILAWPALRLSSSCLLLLDASI